MFRSLKMSGFSDALAPVFSWGFFLLLWINALFIIISLSMFVTCCFSSLPPLLSSSSSLFSICSPHFFYVCIFATTSLHFLCLRLTFFLRSLLIWSTCLTLKPKFLKLICHRKPYISGTIKNVYRYVRKLFIYSEMKRFFSEICMWKYTFSFF